MDGFYLYGVKYRTIERLSAVTCQQIAKNLVRQTKRVIIRSRIKYQNIYVHILAKCQNVYRVTT